MGLLVVGPLHVLAAPEQGPDVHWSRLERPGPGAAGRAAVCSQSLLAQIGGSQVLRRRRRTPWRAGRPTSRRPGRARRRRARGAERLVGAARSPAAAPRAVVEAARPLIRRPAAMMQAARSMEAARARPASVVARAPAAPRALDAMKAARGPRRRRWPRGRPSAAMVLDRAQLAARRAPDRAPAAALVRQTARRAPARGPPARRASEPPTAPTRPRAPPGPAPLDNEQQKLDARRRPPSPAGDRAKRPCRTRCQSPVVSLIRCLPETSLRAAAPPLAADTGPQLTCPETCTT